MPCSSQPGASASWWSAGRGWLNKNGPVVVLGSIVVLGVSLLIANQPGFGTHSSEPEAWAYYYDAEADEYFVGPTGETPPIDSPWGNSAVRALFFSCGDCERDDRFVGYYESYTAEAAEVLRKQQHPDPFMSEESRQSYYQAAYGGGLVSADGHNWVRESSQEGMAIRRKARSRCPSGQKPKLCRPN